MEILSNRLIVDDGFCDAIKAYEVWKEYIERSRMILMIIFVTKVLEIFVSRI